MIELTGELEKLVTGLLAGYKAKNLPGDYIYQIIHLKSSTGSHVPFSGKLLSDSILKNNPASVGFKITDYSFKIGNVTIKNPVITAPLAGISDNTYRIFAHFFGAALTYTEMITGYGIYYRHKKSLTLADITGYERPCALQIFGSNPDIMAEAAAKVEEKADIIDVNMGCPVPKILKTKSGGYLTRDEVKIEKIIKKLSSVLKKPLTIKTRTGWNSGSINILNIAKIAESSGAGAISIHGRTVKQGFSGQANYELIKKVKEKIKIPVIVSGDIDSPGKAKEVLDYTGCDGIMMGRGVKGRLWLIINTLLSVYSGSDKFTDKEFDPGVNWKKDFSKLYLKFLIYFKGEDKGVREFRKHLCWIFRGTRGINKTKSEFFKVGNFKEAVDCIENIRAT